MRPMFKYYGSKWNLAQHYGPPRKNLVIEPFAGSACYSLYWNCRNVKLYDIDDEMCAIWDFLINCSENDIKDQPDWIESIEQLESMPVDIQRLVRRWIWHLPTTEGRISLGSYTRNKAIGRSQWGAIWSPISKERIIKQKPHIKNWTIEKLSYENIPNINAHWHIDHPYDSKAGRAYRHSNINYKHLAEWCRSRQGSVDVCEMEGANWMDFKPLRKILNTARRKYTEVVWSSDNLGRLI